MKLFICLSIAFQIAIGQTTDAPSTPLKPESDQNRPSSIFDLFADAIAPMQSSVAPGSTSPTWSFPPSNTPTVTMSDPPSMSTRPSISPSISMMPTVSTAPSYPPSPQPTESPTTSSQPSLSGQPSEGPSFSPSLLPSSHPTLSSAQVVSARYEQRLLVSTTQIFTQEEIQKFQFLYKRYTVNFGYFVSQPTILTDCQVKKQTISQDATNITMFQSVSGFKNRRYLEFAHVLSVTFTMEYQSKTPQYDVYNYNTLFKDYVNENTTKVSQDMALIGLPVVGAGAVIMFTAPPPTSEPTQKPTVSVAPSPTPTSLPSEMPTSAPSKVPSTIDVVSSSFALGISLGIAGACVVVLLGYMYRMHLDKDSDMSRREKHPNEEDLAIGIEITDLPNEVDHNDQVTRQTDSVTMATHNTLDVESAIRLDSNITEHSTNRQPLFEQQSSSSISHFLAAGMSQRASEMFPNGKSSGAVLAASFSSSNGSYNEGAQRADSFNEPFHPSIFDGSVDELDNYKNQNIEIFRSAVEEAVHDVEGMMMLAVTNALTQSPTSSSDEEDHCAIEAESLYRAFDWWKRNEYSTVDSRREYFQDLLNKIVNLVFYGSIPPLQGYQIVHGCATVVGLPLVQSLPQTTLVIQGMLKTNDLALGRRCIRRAFNQFGEIESIAIAPNNRGFGFVRFVQEKSAQKALEEYRNNEIVIQDVAVSVKILKEGLV